MPELPEVQIVVDQLVPLLCGRKISRLDIRDRKIRLPASLVGSRILAIKRRGKFIVFDLSGDRHLLVHLRMTGWFEFTKPSRYRIALVTGKNAAYFTDSRRFGTWEALSSGQLQQRLARLGPEPLADNFDFDRRITTSRAIKVALLDQRLLAGVGNIYASESLWRARINPRRPAHRLTRAEWRRIISGLRVAMRKGIRYGPRIFAVQQFVVYDRTGKKCRRCGETIRRIIQAQRSTFFCPKCQP